MPKNMSFLPEDYLEKRVQRRTNLICVTLFVLVMSTVAGAFYVTNQQRDDVRAQQLQVQQQYIEAAKRIEQLEELQHRKHQMVRKAKVTSVLIEHVPRSVILAELINNMPASLSLLEFDMDTRVITPPVTAQTALDRAKQTAARSNDKKPEEQEPAIKPTDVSFKVIGVAPTDVQVAQFMTSLGRSSLFKDVNLIFSEQITIDQQEVRRFRVDLKLDQEVDMRSLSLKRVPRHPMHNPMAEVVQFDPEALDSQPIVAPVTHAREPEE